MENNYKNFHCALAVHSRKYLQFKSSVTELVKGADTSLLDDWHT